MLVWTATMKAYLAWLTLLAFACSDGTKRRGDDDSDAGAAGESGGSAGSPIAGSSGHGTPSGNGGAGGTTPSAGGSSATGGDGSSGSSGSGASGGSEPTSGSGSGASGGTENDGGDGSGGDAAAGDGGAAAGQGEGGANGGTGLVSGGDGGTAGAPPEGGLPIVVLLLDGSSSMFENDGWAQGYQALVTDGTLAAFEGRMQLGLAVFQGTDMLDATSEDDPACATLTEVPFSTMVTTDVTTALDSIAASWMIGVKWETPTGHALRRVTSTLSAQPAPEGNRKYILLVTDGEPNTCTVLDPQCGQDNVIKAVQDARAAGITTVPVALGDIAVGTSSCLTPARCGNDHLQDIANAGTGLPVEPPPDGYRYMPCTPTFELAANYATPSGSARYYTSANDAGLTAELTAALESIASGSLP
jgi:hypothetical protein